MYFTICAAVDMKTRSMTTSTFACATDPPNGKKYIFQQQDEANKNHSAFDNYSVNQGRMYEIPGNIKQFFKP